MQGRWERWEGSKLEKWEWWQDSEAVTLDRLEGSNVAIWESGGGGGG